MKRISIAVLMAAVVAFSSFTLLETWKLDKAHSQLGFSVTHLGISEVSGYIKSFDVTIKAEKPDYSDAVVELTGDMASINTGIDMRDNHLKGPDFFDATKFPTINFLSTGLQSVGNNKYKMTGNLTFHGVTRPITLDLWYRGTAANPQSKAPVSGFQVTGTIKRTDFGIATGFPAAMLGDDISIKADGEFSK